MKSKVIDWPKVYQTDECSIPKTDTDNLYDYLANRLEESEEDIMETEPELEAS